jgi:hypothetical protein
MDNANSQKNHYALGKAIEIDKRREEKRREEKRREENLVVEIKRRVRICRSEVNANHIPMIPMTSLHVRTANQAAKRSLEAFGHACDDEIRGI